MTTSNRTRSGGSDSIKAKASRPDTAVTTLYPLTVSKSARSFTFLGVSSTTRILAGLFIVKIRNPKHEIRNKPGKRSNSKTKAALNRLKLRQSKTQNLIHSVWEVFYFTLRDC